MNLSQGNITTVFVPDGKKLTLATAGEARITRMEGDIPRETHQITNAYPITLGPLTVGVNYRLSAITGVMTYTIAIDEEVQARIIRCLSSDLPEFGETGVIYETEEGWKRWDELTGVYLAPDGVPEAPENVDPPEIAGDTAVGSVLSVASFGEWTNRPTSFLIEWQRDGSPIEGETGETYQTVEDDAETDITVEVTAVNSVGSSEPEASASITMDELEGD